MGITPLSLQRVVRVHKLYSLHYCRFVSGHVFPGERHPFWEMVYLDKGEADIGAGERVVRLTQGQVIFHKPDEFHSIWANYAGAPNIIVISFASASPCMRHFRGLCRMLDAPERRLLRQLLEEAEHCFGPTLDYTEALIPLQDAPIGSQQMIASFLEQLLIRILRAEEGGIQPRISPAVTQDQGDMEIIDRAMRFMYAHLDGSVRFADVVHAVGVGQSALKQAFRANAGTSVMACYQNLRLEEARRMLRTGRYNVTQTAEMLGYPGIHAFSRQFRRVIGMTPTAYMRSVRA